jgi:hypothetical protein
MNAVAENIVNTVKSAFGFSVEKFPLSGPDNLRTPFYGLFRSDNQEVVGNAVTKRYVPHQTDDILALVEAASGAFDGVADVRCHFNDGHYLAIQPTKETRKAVFGTNDNIFPRIILNAGYDGRAFHACMGYYRDICRNMAIMRMVQGTTVSIRHTYGLRPKMNDLINTFGTLRQSWSTLEAAVDSLENRRVNMVEFLRAVYGEPTAETGRAVTMHRNRTESIFARLTSERLRSGRPEMQRDWMVSGWEAYNAVQGYVQHEATRHGKATDMARIVLAANDAAVQRAERLVFEMAA